MESSKLFFSPVREDRGWYFVEYYPPNHGYRFATLSVVVSESRPTSGVAEAMEQELRSWLKRYPIPIMVSAFDEKGALYRLGGARTSDHLIGYNSAGAEPMMFWRLVPDEELPGDALDPAFLLRVYAEVPHKTSAETHREAELHAREIRAGWAIVFAWTAVVPAAWAIFEWAGPAWVGALLLVYSLWQALIQALKLLGKVKESSAEKEACEERRRMEHHHYHCERNPEGFVRLKVENFEREERERVQAEARALKEQASSAAPVQHDDAAGGPVGRR